jgi:hypothetical protein
MKTTEPLNLSNTCKTEEGEKRTYSLKLLQLMASEDTNMNLMANHFMDTSAFSLLLSRFFSFLQFAKQKDFAEMNILLPQEDQKWIKKHRYQIRIHLKWFPEPDLNQMAARLLDLYQEWEKEHTIQDVFYLFGGYGQQHIYNMSSAAFHEVMDEILKFGTLSFNFPVQDSLPDKLIAHESKVKTIKLFLEKNSGQVLRDIEKFSNLEDVQLYAEDGLSTVGAGMKNKSMTMLTFNNFSTSLLDQFAKSGFDLPNLSLVYLYGTTSQEIPESFHEVMAAQNISVSIYPDNLYEFLFAYHDFVFPDFDFIHLQKVKKSEASFKNKLFFVFEHEDDYYVLGYKPYFLKNNTGIWVHYNEGQKFTELHREKLEKYIRVPGLQNILPVHSRDFYDMGKFRMQAVERCTEEIKKGNYYESKIFYWLKRFDKKFRYKGI